MTSIYITTSKETGGLVAEVGDELVYELSDILSEWEIGFGESIEVDIDMDDPANDVWSLADALEEALSARCAIEDYPEGECW